MRTYVTSFTDATGDVCEVDQPARTAIAAVIAVHNYVGFTAAVSEFNRRRVAYYQVCTPYGIETYRVPAWSDNRPPRVMPVLV